MCVCLCVWVWVNRQLPQALAPVCAPAATQCGRQRIKFALLCVRMNAHQCPRMVTTVSLPLSAPSLSVSLSVSFSLSLSLFLCPYAYAIVYMQRCFSNGNCGYCVLRLPFAIPPRPFLFSVTCRIKVENFYCRNYAYRLPNIVSKYYFDSNCNRKETSNSRATAGS